MTNPSSDNRLLRLLYFGRGNVFTKNLPRNNPKEYSQLIPFDENLVTRHIGLHSVFCFGVRDELTLTVDEHRMLVA